MTGNHFIVCGDGSLAYRIASELTSRYDEGVVVVLPDPAKNHGPQITALAGVTVLSHAALTSDAFIEAGVATARGLALVGSDDLVNFHAALRADELNPGLRIVVAAFNRRLGQHIRGFFRDCTVLSSSETAAPSFVSAGRSASVLLRYGDDDLMIKVDDDGAAAEVCPPGGRAGAAAAGSGNGLIGMAERARSLGGTLDAGPRPGGGFRVLARLPA